MSSIGSRLSAVMGRIRDVVYQVDEKINTSTFGRIFRLRGCGHVSLAPSRLLKSLMGADAMVC